MPIRKIPLLSLLILLVPLAEQRRARAGDDAQGWWDRAWQYRQRVRIALPEIDEDLAFLRPETPGSSAATAGGKGALSAVATIFTNGKAEKNGRDLRVVDVKGEPVNFALSPQRGTSRFSVYFEAEASSGEYLVYYGNPAAPALPRRWRQSRYQVRTQTLVHGFGYPKTLKQTLAAARQRKQALAATKQPTREREVRQIPYLLVQKNPYGLVEGQQYVTVYEGYVRCESSGIYGFAIDTGGSSFLFIDGGLVVQWPRPHRLSKRWRHRGEVELTEGMHHFLLLQADRHGMEGARLGWRPPFAPRYEQVPKQSFVDYVDAQAVGLEELDKDTSVFFTSTIPSRAVNMKDGTLAYVKLANLSSVEGVRSCTYLWDFGDGTGSEQFSPSRMFRAGSRYAISLKAQSGDEEVGTFKQQLQIPPLPPEDLEIKADFTHCPTVLYSIEQNSIVTRIRSKTPSPLKLRHEASVKGSKRLHAVTDLELSSRGEATVQFPLDMKKIGKRRLEILFSLKLGKEEVLPEADQKVVILPPEGSLHKLRARNGYFEYEHEKGKWARAILCTDIEDQAEYRKWVFVKRLALELDRSRKRVLLLGDAMKNLIYPGKQPDSYVDALKESLEKNEEGFAFVERSGGISPILTDLLLLDRVLSSVKKGKRGGDGEEGALARTSPEIVVISPGPLDPYQGTPVRDFARALDLMVDRARAEPQRPRVILVSPPPLVSNVRLSQIYADAASKVAEKHHTTFVDLHALICSQRRWQKLYREKDANDSLYYFYPTKPGHKLIAEAILSEIH